MTFLHAVYYGIFQGLTEFLPISSSGHLALLPHWFDIKDPGVFFDLMMHIGTAIAVAIYFHKDFIKVFRSLSSIFQSKPQHSGVAYTQNLALAFVSSVILILILKPLSEQFGRNPMFIAFNMGFFGLLLWLSDRKISSGDFFHKRDILKSILIGLSQAIAIFPGVSRSGITLTMARCLGVGRNEGARFSFMLSLPIILAASAAKTKEVIEIGQINFDLSLAIVGVTTSFVVGFITIHFFLKMINKMGLFPFFIYRLILCILLLIYFN